MASSSNSRIRTMLRSMAAICGLSSVIASPSGRFRGHCRSMTARLVDGKRGVPGRPAEEKITARALIVRVTASDVVAPEKSKLMLELIPGSQLVENPGAGHLVPAEAP